MGDSVPILFTGDVEGNFNYLFKKIRNVLLKTVTDKPFSLLICCGNFFGNNIEEWVDYTMHRKKVPLPTFVLGPINCDQMKFYPKLDPCEIVENLTHLGKYGVYTTIEGIRIAYMSGTENGNDEQCTFSLEDVEKLVAACTHPDQDVQVVDILLTYQWPLNICDNLSSEANVYVPKNPSQLVGLLITKLRPQYHIATYEQLAFERPPFPHLDESGSIRSYTRFVGLAAMGNSTKSKCMYALRIQKSAPDKRIYSLPKELTTSNPLNYSSEPITRPTATATTTTPATTTTTTAINPIFYNVQAPQTSKRDCEPERFIKRRKREDQDSNCWFCLSNRKLDKHLIISVANECYIALAKGGIVDNHSLITTIGHYASANCLSETALDEIIQYKMSLKQYFRSMAMDLIFFERAYRSSHMQIHCIPLASSLFKCFKSAFMARVRRENFNVEEYPSGTLIYQMLPAGSGYFYLDLPGDNEILIRINDDDFPLCFGRDIIAEDILNIPERSDWRKCVLDDDIAEAIVHDFRDRYRQYDFTQNN